MGKKADALRVEMGALGEQVEALGDGLEKALALLSKTARAKWNATADAELVRVFESKEV